MIALRLSSKLQLVLYSIMPIVAIGQPCVKIESILVAACTSQPATEGSNEMLRFRVGNTPLLTSQMNVIWSSGQYSFSGIVQNATTANRVSQLNNTIEACGYLVEPTNGILPANSNVLLICGLNVSVTANPFTQLSDTLIVIFHNATNSGGHFLNFTTTGTLQQTTTLSFSTVPGCSSTATYFRNQLVTTAGVPGHQPGATVLFDENMNPTYINNGCSAPINPYSANWTPPANVCNNASPVNLNALITGTSGGVWSGTGVSGGFFNPAGLSGPISITYSVSPSINCPTLQPASQTHIIQVLETGDASWVPPAQICSSDLPFDLNTLVTGTAGGTFSGSGIVNNQLQTPTSSTINVTYSVGSGSCATQQTSVVEIVILDAPVVDGVFLYCNANQVEPLTATGHPQATFAWINNANQVVFTGPVFTPPVAISSTYTVIQQFNGCESPPTVVNLIFDVLPQPTGPTQYNFCQGSTMPEVSAQSLSPVFWYAESALTTLVFAGSAFTPDAGTTVLYAVAQEGNCTSEPLAVSISEEQPLAAQIVGYTTLSLCEQNPIDLQSQHPTQNLWSNGSVQAYISVSTPGWYVLIRANSCNEAKDSVLVVGLPVSAAFTATPEEGFAPLSVELQSLSSGAGECQWFLDGQMVLPDNLTLPIPGSYLLVHYCSNVEGCEDSDSLMITVKNDSIKVFIPNIFTPNGDNQNDLFQVKTENVKTFLGQIFNRWGTLLYEWNNPLSGWNGMSNNKLAPEGTYFYVVQGTSTKDEPFVFKGTLTLIGKP